MQFEDVIGQKEVKEHLVQTVKEERIPHAQLFIGKEGSGALALAIAYAQYVLCASSANQEACNIKANKLAHPDLHFCYPVSTTDKVKKEPVSTHFIGQWREAILDNPYLNLFQWLQHLGIENKQGMINVHQSAEILKTLSLKSFESEFKVMIIWMPEKMNTSTANKLLKIIEEPPQKTLFLLVTENPDALLPTIISRTQIVRIPPISKADMEGALQSRHQLTPEMAASVAHLAGGSYLEALQVLNTSESVEFNREEFVAWMRMCFAKKFVNMLDWIDKISRVGREKQKFFLEYGLHIFRESLMQNYADPELVKLHDSETAFVNKFAPFVHTKNCIQLISEFEKAIYHIERNANAKIMFLDLSLKVLKLLRVKP